MRDLMSDRIEPLIEKVEPLKKKSLNILGEFREFAMKGNVVDLAIGVVIGTAFNAITNSLVKDVIMPPLGLLSHGVNFSNLYVNLSTKHFDNLAQAQAAGVATINYGLFLNNIINFLIISATVFVVVKQLNRLRRKEDKEIQTSKDCLYCLSRIPLAATRCPQCTSQLPEPASESI